MNKDQPCLCRTIRLLSLVLIVAVLAPRYLESLRVQLLPIGQIVRPVLDRHN
jgi:hypothetical protein